MCGREWMTRRDVERRGEPSERRKERKRRQLHGGVKSGNEEMINRLPSWGLAAPALNCQLLTGAQVVPYNQVSEEHCDSAAGKLKGGGRTYTHPMPWRNYSTASAAQHVHLSIFLRLCQLSARSRTCTRGLHSRRPQSDRPMWQGCL